MDQIGHRPRKLDMRDAWHQNHIKRAFPHNRVSDRNVAALWPTEVSRSHHSPSFELLPASGKSVHPPSQGFIAPGRGQGVGAASTRRSESGSPDNQAPTAMTIARGRASRVAASRARACARWRMVGVRLRRDQTPKRSPLRRGWANPRSPGGLACARVRDGLLRTAAIRGFAWPSRPQPPPRREDAATAALIRRPPRRV